MVNAALDVINRLLLQPFGVEKGQEAITAVIHDFLGENRDPTTALQQQKRRINEVADDMRAILATLQSEGSRENPLVVLLLKVLKVLLRKQSNRKALGRSGVQAVAALMSSTGVDTVSCECANVVLNMCYDSGNVLHFLEVDGVEALTPLIRSENEQLKASGLGALQSVCFDKPGRDAARGGLAEVGATSEISRGPSLWRSGGNDPKPLEGGEKSRTAAWRLRSGRAPCRFASRAACEESDFCGRRFVQHRWSRGVGQQAGALAQHADGRNCPRGDRKLRNPLATRWRIVKNMDNGALLPIVNTSRLVSVSSTASVGEETCLSQERKERVHRPGRRCEFPACYVQYIVFFISRSLSGGGAGWIDRGGVGASHPRKCVGA